jgi:hypothetical protein
MSLHTLIRDKADFRQGFSTRVLRPQVRMDRGLQAPPLTPNNEIVGTSFDYLLRFFLQRLNPTARDTGWAAERGVQLIGLGPAAEKASDVPTISRHPKRLKAAAYLADAKRQQRAYLQSGDVTRELLVAVHRLAHLDVATVSGPSRVDWHALSYMSPDDAADLKAMLQLVDEKTFRTSRLCILKPRLPAAELVGGAEPDLILDDCIVDVKTRREARIDVRDFYQLVGYYLLVGLGGVSRPDRAPEQCPITSLGIYLARFGQLWKVPVREVLPPAAVPGLIAWFVETACALDKAGLDLLPALRGPLAAQFSGQNGTLTPERKS